jgi:hypothetical protein
MSESLPKNAIAQWFIIRLMVVHGSPPIIGILKEHDAVHLDFPLLQRIALPITIGSVRYPGIKIHETRIIRLMEVLLHGGTHVGGWTAKQIHEAVLTTFGFLERGYRRTPHV